MKRTITIILFALIISAVVALSVGSFFSQAFTVGISLREMWRVKRAVPQEIPTTLKLEDDEVVGYGLKDEEVFRLNISNPRLITEVRLAFASQNQYSGVFVKQLGPEPSVGERLFFASNDKCSGYVAIRGGKLTWVTRNEQVLLQFDLVVTKGQKLLVFQWAPINQ